DNVRIAYHSHVRYGLASAILRAGSFYREEEEMTEKAVKLLEIFSLDHKKDEIAKNLPYGEQRCLEIARAMASQPKFLLLDEPAAGMNPLETKSLMEFIKMLGRKGYTILVIEHDMKFVMNACNRILVLNFGQKIAEGTPEEIRADQAVREAYFGKGLIVEGVGERA
ncbi:MAG: ATP-binding cassette domain-containing protein, partial [Eubacteriales bacterium]|nr:ATP-binding cassette domain-containing protein [Eubacteriales bacterium]